MGVLGDESLPLANLGAWDGTLPVLSRPVREQNRASILVNTCSSITLANNPNTCPKY